MSPQIGLDIRSGDAQRHAMLLQQAMNLISCYETHQPPHLTLVGDTGPVGLDSDRLE
jgi:hypothetical protein